MKSRTFTVIFIFFLSFQTVVSQTVEKQVEKIRKYYNEVSEKAKFAEEDAEKGEFGDFVMNELIINKRRHQWRAVGTYVLNYKFFYQSIDENSNSSAVVEKHLYPDQLVKVTIKKEISNRIYIEEFIYDQKGSLIFYFQKAENDEQSPAERRIYFVSGKPIYIIENEKKRDKLTNNDLKNVQEILKSNLQIKEFFTKSIRL